MGPRSARSVVRGESLKSLCRQASPLPRSGPLSPLEEIRKSFLHGPSREGNKRLLFFCLRCVRAKKHARSIRVQIAHSSRAAGPASCRPRRRRARLWTIRTRTTSSLAFFLTLRLTIFQGAVSASCPCRRSTQIHPPIAPNASRSSVTTAFEGFCCPDAFLFIVVHSRHSENRVLCSLPDQGGKPCTRFHQG